VVDVGLAASAAVERKRMLMVKSAGRKEIDERFRRIFLHVVTLWIKVMM
jgi:hypothetical protein